MLPGSINVGRRKGGYPYSQVVLSELILLIIGRALAGGEIDTNIPSFVDEEIPEEIEQILEQLLQSLQDKVLSFIFATHCLSRW